MGVAVPQGSEPVVVTLTGGEPGSDFLVTLTVPGAGWGLRRQLKKPGALVYGFRIYRRSFSLASAARAERRAGR